jgi:periplasmic protein TonB
MNNFQKYSLLLAIILSFLLHLIVIKNFSFKIFQSNNQEVFDEMEITIIKPINLFPSESEEASPNNTKLVSKKPLIISDKQINNKNDSNQKIKNPEVTKKSNSKLIDTSKILSRISKIDFSTKTENRKNQQRVKSISANTTDYLYRLYFEAWRQKVEQIGAMNYPREASKLGMFGSLRLTVSLNSDGMIEKLFINKSSGYKELDEAALNIVKLGAPYAKFPTEIQKEVDIINITRKWKFTERNNFSK